jgi:hypothetical protein
MNEIEIIPSLYDNTLNFNELSSEVNENISFGTYEIIEEDCEQISISSYYEYVLNNTYIIYPTWEKVLISRTILSTNITESISNWNISQSIDINPYLTKTTATQSIIINANRRS